jgi:hypothetical protein
VSSSKRLPIQGAGKIEPWAVPDYDLQDAAAIQALYRGTASEEQQRHAFGYIVQQLCAIADPEFRPPKVDPDGRVSAFAGGKRWVGLQLVKFAQLNLALLRKKDSTGKPQPTEQPT